MKTGRFNVYTYTAYIIKCINWFMRNLNVCFIWVLIIISKWST